MRLSTQGSAAGPEHPSKGRQLLRRLQPQQQQQQQQDAELRPHRTPAQPSLSRGKGLQLRLLRAKVRSWAGAGRLLLCCKETSGKWKVKKEIKAESWGREQLSRNFGPCSLLQVTRLHGCVQTLADGF